MPREFYSSLEELNQDQFTTLNTNLRYSNFKQTHFTAGDEDQFQTHRNKSIASNEIPPQCCSISIEMSPQIRWNGYTNLRSCTIDQTFQYIFHKFKKGIFVQIRNNTVSVALPFSKYDFTNEWSERLKFDSLKYSKWNDLFEQVSLIEQYNNFNPSKIHWDSSKWYSNNGLIRYEYPISENDSGVAPVLHMFKELCKVRSIPDIEFFVNRRDFPILTRNYTEPYKAIFGEMPLLSHKHDKYTPILSMCSSAQFADIPIPTWDDWARVMEHEHIYFPKIPYDLTSSTLPPTSWHDKKECAVFRGSSTGLGTTLDTNARLYIASLSLEYPLLLDAGITKWKARPRTYSNTSFVDTFGIDLINSIPLVKPLSFDEQKKYKYIIHIDGYVSAFRLSRELASGSVLLIVRSEYTLWFSHLLIPYTHYIPLLSDASDCIEKIKWCKNNDETCKLISENATQFAMRYLQKDGLLDFLQTILVNVKHRIGNYQYKIPSLIELQHKQQLEWISNYTNEIKNFKLLKENFTRLSKIPSEYPQRCIQRFRGLELFTHRYPHYLNSGVIDSTHIKIQQLMSSEIQQTHTEFIGLACVNPLMETLYNFTFTFGQFNQSLYIEHINDTESFLHYLQSPHFSFSNFLNIVYHIGLVLIASHERVGFIHGNLIPSNILIQQFKSPHSFTIQTSPQQIIQITSTLFPIIINYTKSRCVVDGIEYSESPFNNSHQKKNNYDLMTILKSSIPLVLKKHLEQTQLYRLFQLVSFLSDSVIHTLFELKQWCKTGECTKTCTTIISFFQTDLNIQYLNVPHPKIQHYGTPLNVYYCLIGCGHKFDDMDKMDKDYSTFTLEQNIQFYFQSHEFKLKEYIDSQLESILDEFKTNIWIEHIPLICEHDFDDPNIMRELESQVPDFKITRDWNRLKWMTIEYVHHVQYYNSNQTNRINQSYSRCLRPLWMLNSKQFIDSISTLNIWRLYSIKNTI